MFIGIAVGATSLDAAASGAAAALPPRVPNTDEGIARLVAALTTLAPHLIVLEATGNDHRPLLAALLLNEFPVHVANPAQVAAFRERRLGRHKTDRADAKLLARFADVHHDELRRATPDEPELARLRQLVGYRDDLVAQTTATKNRLHAATWADASAVVAWLEADLAQRKARRTEVEREIAALLAERPETAVLLAQHGVGLGVAAAVLASLPPNVLGHPKAAAADAGVHPRQEQSGQRSASRLSKQGCPALRRYLYMAAMAAIRGDPELAAWHQSLLDHGKAGQSALCAVAHNVLRRLMARIRDLRARQLEDLPMAA
jgi:transposase